MECYLYVCKNFTLMFSLDKDMKQPDFRSKLIPASDKL